MRPPQILAGFIFAPMTKILSNALKKERNGSRASGNVTLADVAKLAGVSPITVSRVLNRPELVTATTLEQVQQVIERTGYTPNLLAGGLASKRSRLVAAIVPSITNAIFVETTQALTDRLWEAGYQVLLGLSGYPGAREDALLAAVLSRRPDAIFLTGINHSTQVRQRLLAARIPIIETWDLTPTPLDMLVGFSHYDVGRAVAEHLMARGRRRLALLIADDERAIARRRGFVDAVEKAGGMPVQISPVEAPSTLPLGRQALAALFDRSGRELPDAVFCGSDLMAHGALEEARARGLSVPGDLAIIGFGGLESTAHTTPTLSTVEIDRPAIGRLAAEMILERIAGTERAGKIVDVGFRILDREST
jgi:LacI family gluconate utilization system Gnt-I transcriptional repressor